MPIRYVIYNPLAGDGNCKSEAEEFTVAYDDVMLFDITKIQNYGVFFGNMESDAEVILCGGDGTLNRFVNDVKGIPIRNKVFFFALGNGNDFARDFGHEKDNEPDFCINQYLERLPTVKVNGTKRLFVNGVGYGIDGYCCEVGDLLKEKMKGNQKSTRINYTKIAVEGLLFHFKPRNAVVTIDGKRYTYKKVWIAPTMNGRYYGGGMMPTPGQNRLKEDQSLSLMVMHGAGRLKTLLMFPSIFKGEHIKYQKHVSIHEGKQITVEFDCPTPLQIDGETVLNVRKYEASVC